MLQPLTRKQPQRIFNCLKVTSNHAEEEVKPTLYFLSTLPLTKTYHTMLHWFMDDLAVHGSLNREQIS